MTKSLFVALAGLGLFACTNEDFTEQLGGETTPPVVVEGPAALTLQIGTSSSMGRAIIDGASDNNQPIDKPTSLLVRFLGVEPSDKQYTEVKLDEASQWPEDNKFMIYNVPEGTTGITVIGHNTPASLSDSNWEDAFKSTSLAESDKGSKKVTLYGSCDLTTQGDTIVGQGGTNGDNGTVYVKYLADVKIKPVVARIEVGNVTFEPHKEESITKSKFKSVKVVGTFVNHVYTEGSFEQNTSTEKVTPATPVFLNGHNHTEDWAAYALKNEFSDQNVIFKAATTEPEAPEETPVFPAGGKFIAYSFFVNQWSWNGITNTANENPSSADANSLPKFTFKCEVEYAEDQPANSKTTLYAVIGKYKVNNSYIKEFVPGKIYQLKEVTIPEGALTPDPEGNQDIVVEATVEVVDWTTADTDGEFIE